jgi:hypothetical protein
VPADLAGLFIRVQENPVQRETFSELGAKAVSIPALGDAVAALRNGKLDGLTTTLWVMPFLHIEEVQHALSLTAHGYQPNIFLLSKAAHGRLSADERAALTAAAFAGAVENRAAVDRADAAALDELRRRGMEIEEHPDRASFRTAVQPLYARWRTRIAASWRNNSISRHRVREEHRRGPTAPGARRENRDVGMAGLDGRRVELRAWLHAQARNFAQERVTPGAIRTQANRERR